MNKVYIIVSGMHQRRFSTSHTFLEILAGNVIHKLEGAGFKNIQAEHRSIQPCSTSDPDNLKYIISEHYLAQPISLKLDATLQRIDATMTVRPAIALHNGIGHVGIAVVGGVNSGKSWIIRMITEMITAERRIPKDWVTEEHKPGTFGWPGKSTDFINEGMQSLLENLHIDVRVVETPTVGRLGDVLALSK